MIRPAPRSFAPMVAHNPTAPCAKIATVSPISICACSAPISPVLSMSQAYTAASSLNSSGIGARFPRAAGTRKYSAMLPSTCAVYL